MNKSTTEQDILRIAQNVVAENTYIFNDNREFRFLIRSKDLTEPEHVHVKPFSDNSKEAKVWLFPVKVEWNHGFSAKELLKVVNIVAAKRNNLARKFRYLKKLALNPNKKAIEETPQADSLDDFASILKNALVPASVSKSPEDYWYFIFGQTDGLEPLIELDDMGEYYTLLFQALDCDFKRRGWMKSYEFRNCKELLEIAEEVHGHLDKIGKLTEA